MKLAGDVDIDLLPGFNPQVLFPWTRASLVRDGELQPHPCGHYPQAIPVDPLTGLAALPYEEAEAVGFSKIDFLHVNVYSHFTSREEIERLVRLEPDWGLLAIPSEQVKLFQLSKRGDVLSAVRPTSIAELADVLALIRPGKKALLNLYKANREATRKALYTTEESGYIFKRSHSYAYALIIILQLHLISSGKL